MKFQEDTRPRFKRAPGPITLGPGVDVEAGPTIHVAHIVEITKMGGRSLAAPRKEFSVPNAAAMPADEASEDTAEALLTEAVRTALEDERPKAVAAWLRRVAESVERGDYEE